MVDRIRYTSVLCNALISKVNLAVLVKSYVLKKSISSDSVVDIRLRILIKVDDLSIAAALEVEYSVVVPAVLVVTDKKSLRICKSVVLLPDRPKKIAVFSPFLSVLAEQCIEAMPLSGRK